MKNSGNLIDSKLSLDALVIEDLNMSYISQPKSPSFLIKTPTRSFLNKKQPSKPSGNNRNGRTLIKNKTKRGDIEYDNDVKLTPKTVFVNALQTEETANTSHMFSVASYMNLNTPKHEILLSANLLNYPEQINTDRVKFDVEVDNPTSDSQHPDNKILFFQIPEEPTKQPVFYKSGCIFLKSTNMFSRWKNTLLTVSNNRLYFTTIGETEETKPEIRCINLLVTKCKVIDHTGLKFSLQIEDPLIVVLFRAETIEDAYEWVEFLNKLLLHLCEVPQLKYFSYPSCLDKKDVLLEHEFFELAETGDIILFRTNNMNAKLQRFFCQSDYDHIALLVKQENKLYVYDSMIEEGVYLTDWQEYRPKIKYYFTNSTYRKLNIPDPELKTYIKEQLANFVLQHCGKKYQLNLGKFFRKVSKIVYEEDQNSNLIETSNLVTKFNNISDNVYKSCQNLQGISSPVSMGKTPKGKIYYRENKEGFFCSELIAAAYKYAGLLDASVSSTRYLPGSFSQKKKLTLLSGSSLSEEYGISIVDNLIIKVSSKSGI